MGLKGRFEETKKRDDHRLKDDSYPVSGLDGDRAIVSEQPALTSLNERLRDDFVADCQRGLDRWNRVIREHGIEAKLTLPHRGFHRAIGNFAEVRLSPDGRLVTQAEWDAGQREWMPTEEDRAYVASLMQPVAEPAKFASWIAAPARGINGQAMDFQYIKLG
jgi:benzoyl-CoA 2,3-dioxygenase component B